LHAGVVVADHEQTRLYVIHGKDVLFTIFIFVLLTVKCLAFAGEFRFARTDCHLFSFELITDLVGCDFDEYFFLFPCLLNADDITIDLQRIAVINSKGKFIFAFSALGEFDVQPLGGYFNLAAKAHSEGFSLLFNADIPIFYFIIRSFIEIDQF
jgi:hypothetical protein